MDSDTRKQLAAHERFKRIAIHGSAAGQTTGTIAVILDQVIEANFAGNAVQGFPID